MEVLKLSNTSSVLSEYQVRREKLDIADLEIYQFECDEYG